MMFFEPPPNIPFWLKILIWIGDKTAGKKMMPARILSWYPRALISSGIFEGLITHKDKTVSKRILKLVRMQVSFSVSCSFCIDMNSFDFDKEYITEEEIEALQGMMQLEDVATFTEREKTALVYAQSICTTPISFDLELIERLKNNFTEREIVILASTASQVNYWTRLIQAFGIAPAGFTDNCPILKLDRYSRGSQRPVNT
jgi:alkylhydroperoxidase family enzyme